MAKFFYRTVDGDTIDDIVFKYYGTGFNVSPLPYVFDANPGLADIGNVYPMGIDIYLPDLPPGTQTTSVISPWS